MTTDGLDSNGGSTAPVEARLAQLEDRVALGELTAVYCHLLDDGHIEDLIELFAPDGEILRDGVLGARGTDDLLAFYARARGGFTLSFHYPHSQVIDVVSPVEATGIVSAHAEMGIDGRCVLAGLRYEDAYVKDDGRWRFARRNVCFLYRLGWDEMSHSYSAARP